MQSPARSPLLLRSELTELPRLVAYISSFAQEIQLNAADTYAITLAAEELFANTAEHSDPPATSISFSLGLDNDSVTATYCDDALQFDPTELSESNTTASAEIRRIGGLGIHFIRTAMRTFHYERDQSRNILTFTRQITK